jgi:hypothetical protein
LDSATSLWTAVIETVFHRANNSVEIFVLEHVSSWSVSTVTKSCIVQHLAGFCLYSRITGPFVHYFQNDRLAAHSIESCEILLFMFFIFHLAPICRIGQRDFKAEAVFTMGVWLSLTIQRFGGGWRELIHDQICPRNCWTTSCLWSQFRVNDLSAQHIRRKETVFESWIVFLKGWLRSHFLWEDVILVRPRVDSTHRQDRAWVWRNILACFGCCCYRPMQSRRDGAV